MIENVEINHLPHGGYAVNVKITLPPDKETTRRTITYATTVGTFDAAIRYVIALEVSTE